jgi:hypothetical protein
MIVMIMRHQVGLSVPVLQMAVWAVSDEMLCSALLCSEGLQAGLLPMAVMHAAVER